MFLMKKGKMLYVKKKHSEYLLIKDRYEKVEAEMKNVVERLKTCTK